MVAGSCVGVGLTPGVGAGAPPLGTTPGLLLWVELLGSEVRWGVSPNKQRKEGRAQLLFIWEFLIFLSFLKDSFV